MATERHYTHSIVSYASIEDIRRLLDKAKAWAYILHDKDEGKAPHYHIVATFSEQKSFKWVREQVISATNQNTFSEAIKGEIGDVLDYFIHKGWTDKYQYSNEDIVYSNREYWDKRLERGEDEENKNDTFMDDLLSSDFSAEKMGRKYGRDFIKNFKSYNEFRKMVLYERNYNSIGQALNTEGMAKETLYKIKDGELIPVTEIYT